MERQQFVARERELEQLDAFLNHALAGQGQVCFVTGEAGSGKTALATEFTRRVLEQHHDLVVTVGQSDAHTGAGDAYLPFREILAQLTGDVEGKLSQRVITEENAGRLRKLLSFSGQALAQVGPDLIGMFVPGAGLATRLAAFVADKAGWLDKLEQLTGRTQEDIANAGANLKQSHIFEQYTNVLKKLAETHPLLLVLDDLQWADAASTDLLFRLGRRIGESRILIVGTYRPAEVALGRAGERHPLDKVLAEFKRYFGEIQVDLDQASQAQGRHFCDAFLDTESNRLGEGFHQSLYQHTGGHPLFTIELLRDMQERGDLVRDEEGRWIEGPVLDWAALPARVEGVIEERIGRLEEELRQVLTVASVEGETFTAQVIARVQDMDTRGLVLRLSGELARRHRLVSLQGTRRLGPQRLSLYRFQHNLFQKYLYQDLDEIERAYLHEDVGSVLEELYADRTDEITVQLAYHFVKAGLDKRAVPYLHQAGQQAAARFANDEAVRYFSHALELTLQVDFATRYDVLLAREKVYDLQGEREEQDSDLISLSKLAEALDDDRKRAQVALHRSNYAETIGDYAQAIAVAQTAVQLGQGLEDLDTQGTGYRLWGVGLLRQGNQESAQTRFEQALEITLQEGDRQGESLVLSDLGIIFDKLGDFAAARSYYERALAIARELGNQIGQGRHLNNLGTVCNQLCEYTDARNYFEQALLVFRQTGFQMGEGVVLGNLGNTSAIQGDYAAAMTYYERSRLICREIGDRRSEGRVLGNLGKLSAEQGNYAAARAFFQQSLVINREIGNLTGEGHILGNLGNVYGEQGDVVAARDHHEQALSLARQTGDRFAEGDQLDCLGYALAMQGDYIAARACCEEALSISYETGNRRGEASSLCHLGIIADRLGDYARARTWLEQSVDVAREAGAPRLEGSGLAWLGLVFHHMKDQAMARESSQRALRITREIGDRFNQGAARTWLGHALTGLGELDRAVEVYQQALNLRQELGQPNLAMESLAGLARISLTRRDLVQARSYVEEILVHLETGVLDGTEEPFRIYLTCYRVLHANGDPRAQEILTTAHRLLQEQAARIGQGEAQRSFLENVATHREIIKEVTVDDPDRVLDSNRKYGQDRQSDL